MSNAIDTYFDQYNKDIAALPGGTIPYQSLLNSALNGLRAAADKTSQGAASGNYLQVGGGVVDMLGSVLPVLSVMTIAGGPATATVFSAVTGILVIVGAVIAGFEPQPEPLKKQIKDALGEQDAKETLQELTAAVDGFMLARAQLIAMDDRTHAWTDLNNIINFTEGNTVSYLHLAKAWLKENKDNSKWDEVFNLYYVLVGFRDATIGLALAKVTPVGDSLKTALGLVKEYERINKTFADEMFDEVLKRGTFYHVGDNRSLYVRPYAKGWNKIENPTRHANGSDITSAQTDEVYVSESGMAYMRDRNPHAIWFDINIKNVIGMFGTGGYIDISTIPYESGSYSQTPAPWKDFLFLLSRNVDGNRHPVAYVSYGPWNNRLFRNFAVEVPTAFRRILAVPGRELTPPNNARWQSGDIVAPSYRTVHLYFIHDETPGLPDHSVHHREIILVPPHFDEEVTKRIFGSLEISSKYANFPNERLLGITQCGDTIYLYSKKNIFAADFDLKQKETIDFPNKDEVRSVSGSNDGQLVVVLGDAIWTYCPYKEKNQRWSKPDLPGHSATWASKYGLAGADNLISHLKIGD